MAPIWDLFQAILHLVSVSFHDDNVCFACYLLNIGHTCFQRPGHNLPSQLGFYAIDYETPTTATTYDTLKWDLAVIRQAVEVVKAFACTNTSPIADTTASNTGETPLVRVAYAQVIYPGHHAARDCYGSSQTK